MIRNSNTGLVFVLQSQQPIYYSMAHRHFINTSRLPQNQLREILVFLICFVITSSLYNVFNLHINRMEENSSLSGSPCSILQNSYPNDASIFKDPLLQLSLHQSQSAPSITQSPKIQQDFQLQEALEESEKDEDNQQNQKESSYSVGEKKKKKLRKKRLPNEVRQRGIKNFFENVVSIIRQALDLPKKRMSKSELYKMCQRRQYIEILAVMLRNEDVRRQYQLCQAKEKLKCLSVPVHRLRQEIVWRWLDNNGRQKHQILLLGNKDIIKVNYLDRQNRSI